MDFKSIKQIVKFCRANGVIEFKHDGLEIKLAPEALATKVNLPKKVEPLGPIPDKTTGPTTPEVPWARYTDEELAVWSSIGHEDVITEDGGH